MIATKISFENYRNIEKADIALSEGLNVLYGDNAQGKTNALEGIYLFAQGRSFRTHKEREYIGPAQDSAYLALTFTGAAGPQQAEMRFFKNGKKSVRKNGVPERKMSEFLGAFRAVMFCPEHLNIVKAGPAERRRFLNEALSQLSSGYISALQRYNGVLAQRNRLLSRFYEDQKTVRQTIGLWNEQLAAEAAVISARRAEYVERLAGHVKGFFDEMTSGAEAPGLLYHGEKDKAAFVRQLEESFETDCRLGTTSRGVHKDDIVMTINGKDARAFASQGQQRSFALALKLSEAEISRGKTQEYPVMLLDDILSELDEKRKNFVLSGIRDRQVIMTTCDGKAAGLTDQDGRKMIKVENGSYQTCIYT